MVALSAQVIAVIIALTEVVRGRALLGAVQEKELAAKKDKTPAGEDPLSSGEREVLWGMFQEHLNTAHHHEEQRERVTTLILVLEVALLGLLAFKDGEAQVLHPVYVTIPVSMLGTFGALFSLKHYERYRFHTVVAGEYRRHLERCVPGAEIGRIFLAAKDSHGRNYRCLSKMHLYLHWTALHLGVAALGLLFTFILYDYTPREKVSPATNPRYGEISGDRDAGSRPADTRSDSLGKQNDSAAPKN